MNSIIEDFYRFFSKKEGLIILNEIIKEHNCSTLKEAIDIVKSQYLNTYITLLK